MTITEKILASHCGRKKVSPGEIVQARLDFVLANDVTAPLSLAAFKEIRARRVFDRERVALVLDHFVPAKDIKSAEQARLIRQFARAQKLRYFFEAGCGIEHALLPEQGLVSPGEVVIGADSHTCTYGALGAFATGVGSTDLAAGMITGELWLRVPESILVEFTGSPGKWVTGKDLVLALIGKIGVDGARYMSLELTGEALDKISIYGRLTICNMAIEAGAKNGIIAADKLTMNYLRRRMVRPGRVVRSDPGASYARKVRIDAGRLEPQVALPSLPENVRPVSRVRKVRIDQVVIGSCTNGWLEDLEMAAKVIDGFKVHPAVRLIVLPATREICLQAMRAGILEKFSRAGAVIGPATCGPCLGGHMGVLAAGERALATTNRNFLGRMGSPRSEVYLCGPAVAAASAVLGRIASPEEL